MMGTLGGFPNPPAMGSGGGPASAHTSIALLPEPLARDVVEDLAQDRDPVARGRLVDGQRRLDAEARRIRHREQPAAHALHEDTLRRLARQRFFRGAVL